MKMVLLALPLLVTGIHADDSQNSLASDQFAVFADPLHGSSHLHGDSSFCAPEKNRPDFGTRSDGPATSSSQLSVPTCTRIKTPPRFSDTTETEPLPQGSEPPVESNDHNLRSRPTWTRGAKNILTGSVYRQVAILPFPRYFRLFQRRRGALRRSIDPEFQKPAASTLLDPT